METQLAQSGNSGQQLLKITTMEAKQVHSNEDTVKDSPQRAALRDGIDTSGSRQMDLRTIN